jgi:hypothetical protein
MTSDDEPKKTEKSRQARYHGFAKNATNFPIGKRAFSRRVFAIAPIIPARQSHAPGIFVKVRGNETDQTDRRSSCADPGEFMVVSASSG